MNTLSCSLAVQELIFKLFSHPCFCKEMGIAGGRNYICCPGRFTTKFVWHLGGHLLKTGELIRSFKSLCIGQDETKSCSLAKKPSDSQGHSASSQTVEDYINKLSWCSVRIGKEWWIQIDHGLQSLQSSWKVLMRSISQTHILGLTIEILLSLKCSEFGIIVGVRGMEGEIKHEENNLKE